ncbi:MAG: hypothetical protein II882_04885 [Lachnospiraceae bacterium]|nr:hypothetical protein [Lachnospiraceae bacterium]
MKHKKEMDAEIRSALEAYVDQEPISQSDTSEDYSFQELDRKMENVYIRIRKRQARKTVGRIAAACFIFLLVSFSLTMVFSKEARAAVSRWTKQLFEGGIAYIFRGELDDAYTIPKIEPGWLPDGVELVQYEEVPDISYDYLYQNQDESKLILFGVGIVHEGSNMTVSDLEDYTHETVIWDGKTIEHYFLGEEDHTLWWFEDEDRIIVTVDCYLTTEELQLFISNLKRVN